MVWKCVHGVLTVEKYCPKCNSKRITYRPGQTLGNRPPTMMKVEKR